MTTTCPNCKSPVAAGERFCGECGTDLTTYQQQGGNRAVVPPASQPTSQPPAMQPPNQPPAIQQIHYQPTSTPQPPVQPQVTPYSMGQTPGYPGGVAPVPQAQRGGVPAWLGYMFLGLAVLAFILMLVLGYASAGTQPTAEDADSARLGSWICAFGLLIVLGIPGLVLFIIGRRR